MRLGRGDGTFAPPIYYDVIAYSTTPEAVVLADLDDDDGDLDVITCDWSGTTGDGIGILYNDGTGGLGGAHHVPAGQGTADLTVADVDGDGAPDVVTSDRMSLAITVHKNPGDGRLPILQTRSAAPASNIRLDAGDVDGDGDLDVFASGEAFGVPGGLLRNHGDGAFAEPVVYTHSTTSGRGVSRAKLRDIDGDGDLDLLYNDAHTDFQDGYNFYSALNDGTGTFGPITTWFIGTCGTGDVDAFDLDNDGDLDAVNLEELNCAGSDFGNRIFVSLNDGDGAFQHLPPIRITAGPRALTGGDLDEDGKVDLVTGHWTPYGARNVVNVHLGNGDGTFQEEAVITVGQGPMDIVVADLDGDGHLDLATANSGSDNLPTNQETMSMLWGAGDGTFSPAQTYYAPFSPDLLGATGIAAGDADGDGDLDLMMTTVANGVAMYYNTGARGFDFAHRLGIYWRPFDPFYADFDGDSIPDLATLVGVPPSGLPRELAILPGATGIIPTADGPRNDPALDLPSGYVLSPIYPNPFNPQARFTLDVDETQVFRIDVFDVLSRRLATLHDGALAAGSHTFALDGWTLPTGTYVVRVTGQFFAEVRRATLVR